MTQELIALLSLGRTMCLLFAVRVDWCRPRWVFENRKMSRPLRLRGSRLGRNDGACKQFTLWREFLQQQRMRTNRPHAVRDGTEHMKQTSTEKNKGIREEKLWRWTLHPWIRLLRKQEFWLKMTRLHSKCNNLFRNLRVYWHVPCVWRCVTRSSKSTTFLRTSVDCSDNEINNIASRCFILCRWRFGYSQPRGAAFRGRDVSEIISSTFFFVFLPPQIFNRPATLSACGHTFCTNCIDEYSSNHSTCPGKNEYLIRFVDRVSICGALLAWIFVSSPIFCPVLVAIDFWFSGRMWDAFVDCWG